MLKDCSIIIRGHKSDNVKSAIAIIIDLDSKSSGKIEKCAVKSTLEAEDGVEEAEGKVCVDDYPLSKRVP